ncbi:nuclear transport factor 2 family protein [Filimonas lacunae]|nr:DUF4878 domain-containing protein [Filimonas lacunae]BAV05230.1 hypothetical protein FLA_1237 [Filimonas lacunae]
MMLLLLIRCSPSADSPSEAARLFFTAFQEKNYAKAKKYATRQSAEMLTLLGNLGEKLTTSSKEAANFTTKTLKESESTATVQVVLPDNRKATIMQLEKENGKWKVAFDKSLD